MSKFTTHSVSCEIDGKTLTLETGKLAKQAAGSVLAKFGDTHVLVTVCCSSKQKEDIDFMPLTVEYSEKFYATGKIPGGFFKREGRPSQDGILSCRLIDRPIRPLFPEGFYFETQIVATILSLDPEFDPDVAAAAGVSAALHISEIPFNGPTATCKIGRINGGFVINPGYTIQKEKKSDIDITIAGTKNAIMMVEGGAQEISEAEVLDALLKGHEAVKKICAIVDELREKCGVPKREFTAPVLSADIESQVKSITESALKEALKTKEKKDRGMLISATKKSMLETLVPESLKASDPKAAKQREKEALQSYENLLYTMMRDMILDTKTRIDGRDLTTVRYIETEVDLLPRAHGSSLFTRGETQVLSIVTLGTKDDEQLVDSPIENSHRNFYLHYNFPPFSVGECGRLGMQSRREVGHGALAERAIKALIPSQEQFPYTIRVVCETLESNGSSSMGSVCSASMALMAAGVPYPKPVAGIAMGLIKKEDKVAVLSDILGDEDHLGDMDFKVAGTKDGVTSIQMDIKIEGVNESIMKTALAQAKEGRLHILEKMAESISETRSKLSPRAPRIHSLTIPKDKIAMLIGPGGKMIKEIIATTGAKVDINDDGVVKVASADEESIQKALAMIEGIVAEIVIGKTYHGTVKKIVDFGAFIGVLPNQDGLLHVSEIAHERVENVNDHLKEGDKIDVVVLDIDDNGKIRLSRKELLPLPEGFVPRERPQRPQGGGGGRDGGRRDGGGGGNRPRGRY